MIPGLQPAELATSPFPAGVAYSCLREEETAGMTIAPEEEAILGPRAVKKRRAELRLGRLVARLALQRHGVASPPPILKGPSREPLWPVGVTGSISHSSGVAVAAVASRDAYGALGIDIERSDERNLDDFPLEQIASTVESSWIRGGDGAERAIALFSAKETIYKALFPICRRYIGFAEVSCSWDPNAACFRCELLTDLSDSLRKGRSIAVGARSCGPFVLTYLALSREELTAQPI